MPKNARNYTFCKLHNLLLCVLRKSKFAAGYFDLNQETKVRLKITTFNYTCCFAKLYFPLSSLEFRSVLSANCKPSLCALKNIFVAWNFDVKQETKDKCTIPNYNYFDFIAKSYFPLDCLEFRSELSAKHTDDGIREISWHWPAHLSICY